MAGIYRADRFEERRRPDRSELRRLDWALPGCRDERRGGEVVDLCGVGRTKRLRQRRLVKDVGI